jgi:hypothetical protein
MQAYRPTITNETHKITADTRNGPCCYAPFAEPSYNDNIHALKFLSGNRTDLEL